MSIYFIIFVSIQMHVKLWNWSEQSGSLLAWCASAMLSGLSPWTKLMSGDSCRQLWKLYYGGCLKRENFHTVNCVMWKLPSVYEMPVGLNHREYCRKMNFVFSLCFILNIWSIFLLLNLVSIWSNWNLRAAFLSCGATDIMDQITLCCGEPSCALQGV